MIIRRCLVATSMLLARSTVSLTIRPVAKLSATGEICIFASAETHLVIHAADWL